MIEELLNQVRLMIDSKRSNASCIWFCDTGLSQYIVTRLETSKGFHIRRSCLRPDIGRSHLARRQT